MRTLCKVKLSLTFTGVIIRMILVVSENFFTYQNEKEKMKRVKQKKELLI